MWSLPAKLNDCRRFLFAPRAERRFARQASAELLELYEQQRRAHPEISGRALYQEIVAQRLGPQAVRANELVRRAEESFTDWPRDRELKFSHVVHYLVFYGIHASGSRPKGHYDEYGSGGREGYSRKTLISCSVGRIFQNSPRPRPSHRDHLGDLLPAVRAPHPGRECRERHRPPCDPRERLRLDVA